MISVCTSILLCSDIFATKTGLQDDDFDITNKLRQVKRYYDHLYQIVDDLSESYDCYMTNCWPAFIRYIKLKSMITECICRYNAKWDTINDHTGLRGAMEKAAEIKNIKSGRFHLKRQNTFSNKNLIGYILNKLVKWTPYTKNKGKMCG